MEYIRVTFLVTLFVVPSYSASVNGSLYCTLLISSTATSEQMECH
jgi:hypothetical protein